MANFSHTILPTGGAAPWQMPAPLAGAAGL